MRSEHSGLARTPARRTRTLSQSWASRPARDKVSGGGRLVGIAGSSELGALVSVICRCQEQKNVQKFRYTVSVYLLA